MLCLFRKPVANAQNRRRIFVFVRDLINILFFVIQENVSGLHVNLETLKAESEEFRRQRDNARYDLKSNHTKFEQIKHTIHITI